MSVPDTPEIDAAVIRQCDSCRFWKRIDARSVCPDDGTLFAYMLSDTEDDISDTERNLVLEGSCKRFPPVIVSDVLANVRELPLYRGRFEGMTPLAMLESASVWPVTLASESCGEWAAE